MTNYADIQVIRGVFEEKFIAIKQLVKLVEEHGDQYVQDESLLHPAISINRVSSELSGNSPGYSPHDTLMRSLRSLESNIMDRCVAVVSAKLHRCNDIKRLYLKQVLGKKRARTIFYKAPSRISIEYKRSEIAAKLKAFRKLSQTDPLSRDWREMVSSFEHALKSVDDLCGSMADVLERTEKYNDDKTRMWVAILALSFTLFINAVFPIFRDQILAWISAVWVYLSSIYWPKFWPAAKP